jgi:signal transduction histidine kinase
MGYRIIFTLIFVLANALQAFAIKENKTILIIHSYNYGLSWTEDLNKSIIRTVSSDSSIQADFRVEYLDTKHFESPDYLLNLAKFFLFKYRALNFDLIVATDNAAFNFLENYRDSLPGKPPVVFCGLNFVDEIPCNFTGILEDIDIDSNISTILSLHPQYKKIYFVLDRSITGNIIRKKSEEIISKSFPDLNFEFLTDYSFTALKQKLASLQKGEVVLLTTFNIDKEGNQISYDIILDQIKPICNVPIYGTWDFYLGKGIVGGKITRAITHGELAGKIALQLLKGAPAASIPVMVGPTEFVFDKKVMREFGINQWKLPENAIIINSPITFIQENLQAVIFILVIFCLMLMVIVIMTRLFNNEKQIRKKEQAYLQEIRNKSIELEGALQLAQKSNQLKSAFLSNLSHEIRTPMNAIVGFSDLLISNFPDKKLEEYVSIIKSGSSQLLSIINDIIEMSMIDTNQVHLHYGNVNVNQTIDEICASFALALVTNPKVELIQNLPPNDQIIQVYTDEVKLRQILTNLVSNALKFTPEGFVEIGYYQKNGYLEFYVKDTGIGIEPKHHEEIFERFWRLDRSDLALFRGLGIGLTLSRSFVQLMGGNIWLHSQPGKGSTFYFTIPVKQAPVIETKNEFSETGISGNFEKENNFGS